MSAPRPAYFERTGPDAFAATEYTGGAWSTTEQHVSPLCGLVTAVILDHAATDLLLSRICFEILGVVAIDEVQVAVRTLRPGRTIALVGAEVTCRGRTVLLARAWLLAASDTSSIGATEDETLPGPDGFEPHPMSDLWPGRYVASVEAWSHPDDRPGRGRAWLRTPIDLVAGEQPPDPSRWVALVDSANGLAVRVPPRELAFPNVDLTVHLHRQPSGSWIGFDTRVSFGPRGQGLTSSVLHDEHGPVGTAAQVLTLRPRA